MARTKPYRCRECGEEEYVVDAPLTGTVQAVVDGFGVFRRFLEYPTRLSAADHVGGLNDVEVRCLACGTKSSVADLTADEDPPMTREEFVEGGGCVCPFCREAATEVDSTEYVEGGVVAESYCTECNRSWHAMYRVDGYELPDDD